MTLLKNRYQLLKPLGVGGFGETFLAEDTDLPSRRKCVVKRLKPDTMGVGAATLLELFEREARTLEALGEGGQGRIPRLHAYFADGAEFYLVQEFIEGKTLETYVRERGALSETQVRRLLLELLATLEYVHGQKVIHRDIKPPNVMIRSSDGLPVLIDFGIVKHRLTTALGAMPAMTKSNVILGTPGYAPPEQWQGRTVLASDLHALARTAVFALTGEDPQHLNDLVTGDFAWRDRVPSISTGFTTVLDRAMDEDFRKRFPTAGEMRAALAGLSIDNVHERQTVVSPIETTVPPTEQVVVATINPDPEIEYWTTIRHSTNPEDFLSYIQKYPYGHFVELAGNRLRDIKPPALPTTPSLPRTFTNGIGMEFVLIPAGSFMMGGDEYDSEKPIHRVTIGKPFYLGKYQVTQGEWKAVMGSNPSYFTGDERLPVENVSWNDCQEFLKKLNKRKDGYEYRLPSEAEWEYACRSGTTTAFAFGATITTDQVNGHSDYSYGSTPKGEYRKKTTRVGNFPPNAWGLYDMHGNVWEWCQDRWYNNYAGTPNDGIAWESGSDNLRVLRGGSWRDRASFCRSAVRSKNTPVTRRYDIGFRVIAARTK